MHHLHFRYVTEQPPGRKFQQLFQLMDDLESKGRAALLRDIYHALNIFPSDTIDNIDQRHDWCYREFKTRLARLAKLLPDEDPFVFGLVCYIASNAVARSQRMFGVIERHRGVADVITSSKKSITALREEVHQLNLAYQSFCELVVAGLLDDFSADDFGSEWLLEEGDSDDATPLNESSNTEISTDQLNLNELAKNLFPFDEEIKPCDPAVITFIEQVAAHFERSLPNSQHSIAVRVADKAVNVAVSPYCGPSDDNPTAPLVLRLNISDISISDFKSFKSLRLRPVPSSFLKCRLEFSVLPNELSLLVNWITEWILGQESRGINPPPIPIRLAGENEAFEFVGDKTEKSPFVNLGSKEARRAFTTMGSDWRDVDYLWSGAAREAYNAWKGDEGD